jgi:glyoxylase-like metal-dependent hydrolase (beta-lactamase superfamily II)
MRKVEQLGRRTFLMSAGKASFALLSEVTFGFGRRGLAVALGGTGLAAAACQPQILQPQAAPTLVEPEEAAADYARVFMDFVSAYVLVRGSEIAIVDTGTPGNTEKFADVIQAAGLGWSDVNHVILTHNHGDHVGGLNEIMGAATAATIYAGAADIASIQAPQTIQPVLDGDEVFGMQIIGTPGHTAGHISVFDPFGSLLVAGDALIGGENGVEGASARFTADMEMANESIRKLAALSYETLVFGHGEPIEGGASDAVAALAATL